MLFYSSQEDLLAEKDCWLISSTLILYLPWWYEPGAIYAVFMYSFNSYNLLSLQPKAFHPEKGFNV